MWAREPHLQGYRSADQEKGKFRSCLLAQSGIHFSLVKLGRGDPCVSRCRPIHPAEFQIEDRISV
jgi:hypothetical protein